MSVATAKGSTRRRQFCPGGQDNDLKHRAEIAGPPEAPPVGSRRRPQGNVSEIEPRDWSGQLDSNQRPAVPKTYQLFPQLPSSTLTGRNARRKVGPTITSCYPLPAV